MTSIVATFLLFILTPGSVLFLVMKHVARGRTATILTAVSPALVVFFAVFAVYVLAWMLAALQANL